MNAYFDLLEGRVAVALRDDERVDGRTPSGRRTSRIGQLGIPAQQRRAIERQSRVAQSAQQYRVVFDLALREIEKLLRRLEDD